MIEALLALDHAIFFLINGFNFPWLDTVMAVVSQKFTWFPFYGLILFMLWYKLKLRSIPIIIALLLNVLLADVISSQLIKPIVERPRPCHEETFRPYMHLPEGCGGAFGFVSSHAANSVGLAFLLFLLFHKWEPRVKYMFAWAGLVCYSRVYLGAHYPSDVVAGGLLGLIIAAIINGFYQKMAYSIQPWAKKWFIRTRLPF